MKLTDYASNQEPVSVSGNSHLLEIGGLRKLAKLVALIKKKQNLPTDSSLDDQSATCRLSDTTSD